MLAASAWGAAAGEASTLLRDETLRKQPRSDAQVVKALPAGTEVGVLDSRPGWYRVSSATASGWVRMFSVRRADAAPLPAPGSDISRGAAAPSRLAGGGGSHALILGVGKFVAANIPALPGVEHDLRSAQSLAQAMGVPVAQTTVVQDADLSLEGMVRAVQRLVDRVQLGDRVFLYFSGHGTRYLDRGRPGSPCVTSLLTHDGEPFTDSMLAEALTLLADKTDKLFVFVDACFSGGAVAPARGAALRPKFFARTGAASQCGTPSNVVTRGLAATGPQRWAGRDNFIYLTAARDTEVAFEDAMGGGFATRAFRDCALREARDLDGSGNLSVAEIGQCAQQRIDSWVAGHRDFMPHHLTIFGNSDFVPTLAPVPTPAPLPLAAAPPPVIHAERTLRDIYGQRDARRSVSVKLAKSALRIGRDSLEFSVQSSHPGSLYLLYAGSDGTTFDMLFPNQLDRDNLIPAGRPVHLPRPGWAIQARGPAGTNRLLVIVADSPRDFSSVGLQPAGVFASLPASPAAARAITFAAGTAPAGRTGDCGPVPAGSDTGLVCSNAFGAALVDVAELP